MMGDYRSKSDLSPLGENGHLSTKIMNLNLEYYKLGLPIAGGRLLGE